MSRINLKITLRAAQWIMYTPGATFPVVCDARRYADMIGEQGGSEALRQWRQLEAAMAPLQVTK